MFCKELVSVVRDLKSDSMMLCRQGYLNDIRGVSYAIAIANYSPITIAAFRFATSGRGRTSASVAFSVSAPMPPMRQIGEGSSGCIFALSGYDFEQGDLRRCFGMLATFISQEIRFQIF